jgi:diacylglycerol kinase
VTERAAQGGLLSSLPCAWAGHYRAVGRDRNLRVHLGATVLVASWAAVLRLPAASLLWLALAVTVVWVTELLNTSLECVVDLVSPGHHPLAGLAKDIAAAAVLVACGFAVLVGLVILGPSLWEYLCLT